MEDNDATAPSGVVGVKLRLNQKIRKGRRRQAAAKDIRVPVTPQMLLLAVQRMPATSVETLTADLVHYLRPRFPLRKDARTLMCELAEATDAAFRSGLLARSNRGNVRIGKGVMAPTKQALSAFWKEYTGGKPDAKARKSKKKAGQKRRKMASRWKRRPPSKMEGTMIVSEKSPRTVISEASCRDEAEQTVMLYSRTKSADTILHEETPLPSSRTSNHQISLTKLKTPAAKSSAERVASGSIQPTPGSSKPKIKSPQKPAATVRSKPSTAATPRQQTNPTRNVLPKYWSEQMAEFTSQAVTPQPSTSHADTELKGSRISTGHQKTGESKKLRTETADVRHTNKHQTKTAPEHSQHTMVTRSTTEKMKQPLGKPSKVKTGVSQTAKPSPSPPNTSKQLVPLFSSLTKQAAQSSHSGTPGDSKSQIGGAKRKCPGSSGGSSVKMVAANSGVKSVNRRRSKPIQTPSSGSSTPRPPLPVTPVGVALRRSGRVAKAILSRKMQELEKSYEQMPSTPPAKIRSVKKKKKTATTRPGPSKKSNKSSQAVTPARQSPSTASSNEGLLLQPLPEGIPPILEYHNLRQVIPGPSKSAAATKKMFRKHKMMLRRSPAKTMQSAPALSITSNESESPRNESVQEAMGPKPQQQLPPTKVLYKRSTPPSPAVIAAVAKLTREVAATKALTQSRD